MISGLQSIMLWVLQAPELIGILPPLVGLVFLATVMRFWQPKHIYREPTAPTLEELAGKKDPAYSLREIANAWSPFIFLSATILLWSTVLKPVFDANGPLGFANLSFHVPGIHHQIGDGEGLAIHAVFNWNILGAAGTAILVAALLSALTSKITVRETLQELNGSWQQLKKPIYMICLVMSVANLMNYAGMTSSIALAVASAGAFFPLFSPAIGWVGVFVTGSVTNNNVLFAGLQASTAQQIGVDPAMLVAANTSGGVMGKIVSPQSIAVAVAAVNQAGQESKVTSITIKYSLFLLVLLCIWTYLLSLFMHNVLFAGLQASTAQQIGVDPAMLVAANTSGGVMGKIVSPQSIAVAVAAVNQAGQESKVTSITIKYSLFLLVLLCIWTYLLSLFMH